MTGMSNLNDTQFEHKDAASYRRTFPIQNPEQLRMFMRPGEIKGHYYPSDVDEDDHRFATPEKVWKTKEKDNRATWTEDGKKTNFNEVIRTQGVHEPVDVITETPKYWNDNSLENGHHRVQAAEAAEKKTGRHYYLPVRHHAG